MKKHLIEWLQFIEKQDGTPPNEVIAFNFGLFESDDGYVMYLVGGFEYSEDDDDWANMKMPTKDYRYLRFPDKLQEKPWEAILEHATTVLLELEQEGTLATTLVKNAKAITTGFDEGTLIKIR